MASLAGSDIEPSGTVADGGLLCKLEKIRENKFFFKKNKNWRWKFKNLKIVGKKDIELSGTVARLMGAYCAEFYLVPPISIF